MPNQLPTTSCGEEILKFFYSILPVAYFPKNPPLSSTQEVQIQLFANKILNAIASERTKAVEQFREEVVKEIKNQMEEARIKMASYKDEEQKTLVEGRMYGLAATLEILKKTK